MDTSSQEQQQQPFLSGFTSLGHQHFFWLQASSTKPVNGNRWKWRTTASLPGGNGMAVLFANFIHQCAVQ
ncbi:unnamed protein product [Prunus armeniaca]|uniref:Uncharacterized protein n=1 Tax=Prunus armeniaca TaxID=36596 RepID=A0A6J5XZ00_PRUAR|nr:unnamed protein product [Prunus armeniaca]